MSVEFATCSSNNSSAAIYRQVKENSIDNTIVQIHAVDICMKSGMLREMRRKVTLHLVTFANSHENPVF